MTRIKLVAAVASAALIGGGVAALPGSGTTTNPWVGTWQRTNSCTAFVKAMRQAGLGRDVRGWLVGGGYLRSVKVISRIAPARPCRYARNAKHSHFFTAAGEFGSRDEKGNRVDDGDYKVIAPHTLAFPSHASEFGYMVKVRYRVEGGRLRFDVVVPHPCTGRCREATGWALSAFYAGPAFTLVH